MKRIDKCCGGCAFFKYEDTDGWGLCAARGNRETRCSQGRFCIHYEDEETIRRHHIAVLTQLVRWGTQDAMNPIYKCPNADSVFKAVNYAIKFMKGEQ